MKNKASVLVIMLQMSSRTDLKLDHVPVPDGIIPSFLSDNPGLTDNFPPSVTDKIHKCYNIGFDKFFFEIGRNNTRSLAAYRSLFGSRDPYFLATGSQKRNQTQHLIGTLYQAVKS